VQATDSGLPTGEMDGGGIGVAEKDLRIVADRPEVEVRDQAYGVVTADGRDDRLDGRIGEGGHQILRPRLRMGVEPFGVLQRMRRLDYLQPETLLQLPFARLTEGREDRGAAPRERDGRHPVAPQPRRLDERPAPPGGEVDASMSGNMAGPDEAWQCPGPYNRRARGQQDAKIRHPATGSGGIYEKRGAPAESSPPQPSRTTVPLHLLAHFN
jgi:hypothetical protein